MFHSQWNLLLLRQQTTRLDNILYLPSVNLLLRQSFQVPIARPTLCVSHPNESLPPTRPTNVDGSNDSSSTHSNSSNPSTGVIVAAVIAGAAIISLLFYSYVLYSRAAQRRAAQRQFSQLGTVVHGDRTTGLSSGGGRQEEARGVGLSEFAESAASSGGGVDGGSKAEEKGLVGKREDAGCRRWVWEVGVVIVGRNETMAKRASMAVLEIV